MRLFIAIAAPEAWRAAAAAQQRALLEALPVEARTALRLVDPALMHVTLRFLGEVGAGGVGPLPSALDAIPAPDVALTLALAGTFGPPARTTAQSPSGVWLGLAGDIAALAAHVEGAVRLAGLPPQPRPFTPHLTLARVAARATADARRAVAAAASALPPPPPSPHRARQVVLVRSHLGGPRSRDPESRYEVLSRHP